jgi:hypothetical protein
MDFWSRLERQAVVIGATTYPRNDVIVLVGRVTLAVLRYSKALWASIVCGQLDCLRTWA